MLVLRFKRILYIFLECLVFVLGLFASVILAAVVDRSFKPALPFLFGLAVTLISFFYLRRKTLPFKIEYEATRFLEERRVSTLHPRRARLLRRTRRLSLWLPSTIALATLLCFPQTSHVFHPRSADWRNGGTIWIYFPTAETIFHPGVDHLLHNQIEIPWGWTVLASYESSQRSASVLALSDQQAPWPFGTLSIWNSRAQLRLMTFEVFTFEEFNERRSHKAKSFAPNNQTSATREIQTNGLAISCLQTRYDRRPILWDAQCETTVPSRFNFSAHYFGPADGLPAFYGIVETAKPPK